MNEIDMLYPAFVIMAAVYVLARIINFQEEERKRKQHIRQEIDRQDRIDALYGKDKKR